jgi:hypothetical protein
MSDLAASYAMNVAENPFGDGDGYGRLAGVIQSASATPASPASGSTAPRAGMQCNHHFAAIIAVGAVLLILSHHIGFRGAVAV